MITASLGKFSLTISITNLTCKYLMNEAQFVNEFRFVGEIEIPRLSEAQIVCCQETVANN